MGLQTPLKYANVMKWEIIYVLWQYNIKFEIGLPHLYCIPVISIQSVVDVKCGPPDEQLKSVNVCVVMCMVYEPQNM